LWVTGCCLPLRPLLLLLLLLLCPNQCLHQLCVCLQLHHLSLLVLLLL
jgi:hypothetical protein